MSSKNISVRDDIYVALKNAKGDDESFSDVIERLLESEDGEHPLYNLVGMLDEAETERVREQSSRFRGDVDDRMEPRS